MGARCPPPAPPRPAAGTPPRVSPDPGSLPDPLPPHLPRDSLPTAPSSRPQCSKTTRACPRIPIQPESGTRSQPSLASVLSLVQDPLPRMALGPPHPEWPQALTLLPAWPGTPAQPGSSMSPSTLVLGPPSQPDPQILGPSTGLRKPLPVPPLPWHPRGQGTVLHPPSPSSQAVSAEGSVCGEQPTAPIPEGRRERNWELF